MVDELTPAEKYIVEKLKECNKDNAPVPQIALHHIFYAATKASGQDPFGFWEHAKIDCLEDLAMLSNELQTNINSLVQKGYLSKDSESRLTLTGK